MFPLHDRTRRRIVLAAFGAFGVLPTLLILLWGLSRQTPWHTMAAARRLENVLGLRVRMDRVRNTRPGVWRYERLSIFDPETGQTILSCEQLDVAYTGHGSDAPATLVLRARRPVGADSATAVLYQVLSRAMQGQMGPSPLDVRWTADELTLGEGERAIRLAGFSGGTQSHPAGVQAQLQFRLADGAGAGAEPAHIEILRNRQASPADLELKLYTGAVALPCRLLAVGLPALGPLGPQSQFRGYLQADRTPQGWRGELTGYFSDVDLGRIVRERFAQHLTGAGQVTVERVRFNGGRVEEAWGSATIGPGTISRRLLDAAVEQMGLIQNAPPTDRDDPLAYRQLAANWRLSADGLSIQGRCPAAGPGTLLAGTEPWQIGEPVAQPVPVAALVRTLVPDGLPEVPAAPQTAWLLRHLPLPESDHEAADRRAAAKMR
ncbi:MAG: hypothetical protein RBS80_15980 [Thermoguttaceae bacterium]|jgi:hypothetical protein|nr:hypothetical protein [Thermoguttaceae bacterium]